MQSVVPDCHLITRIHLSPFELHARFLKEVIWCWVPLSLLDKSCRSWAMTYGSFTRPREHLLPLNWLCAARQPCSGSCLHYQMTAARSKASPNSRLQVPLLISFLLRPHSLGLSAGLCHLSASPSWRPWSQMGCTAAVAVPADCKTQVPFLSLPGGFTVPFPTPCQPAWGTVCILHRMLTVPGAKKKPPFFFFPPFLVVAFRTQEFWFTMTAVTLEIANQPSPFPLATGMQEECCLCCAEPRSAESWGNVYPVGSCRAARQRMGRAT